MTSDSLAKAHGKRDGSNANGKGDVTLDVGGLWRSEVEPGNGEDIVAKMKELGLVMGRPSSRRGT